MAAKVEVCVIGTSDMGGRGMPARRPIASGVRTKAQNGTTPPRGETGALTAAAAAPKGTVEIVGSQQASSDAANVHVQKPSQEEFGFGEVESRGHFEKTDRNLFDGQDLDVPTYLRRGIKISL